MKTYLITGNDTGVGKTKVTSTFLKNFLNKGLSKIQVIKPIQTGVDSPLEGDIQWVLSETRNPTEVEGHTCFSFKKALAPHTAAQLEGKAEVTLQDVVQAVHALPKADIRIIEGAGGIASPFNSKGEDFLDMAKALKVDGLIIVIENRVGALGQAQMANHYIKNSGLNGYFWLNEVRMQHPEVLESNYSFIKNMETPLLAKQDFEADVPEYFNFECVS